MSDKPGQGAATNSVEYSPERLKRMKRVRERQENRWVGMASKVIVSQSPYRCGNCNRYAMNAEPCTACGAVVMLIKTT